MKSIHSVAPTFQVGLNIFLTQGLIEVERFIFYDRHSTEKIQI